MPNFVLVGWSGITAEIPEDWNLGAVNGDSKGGYLRFDDDTMSRLEIKWSTGTGFVDLGQVVDKYLRDLQKGRKKDDAEVVVEQDVKLISKHRRRKGGLKCFHWRAEGEGWGAAWICKECGRTIIAQVASPAGTEPEAAQELAASVLLSIQDHAQDGWITWSAYGFTCQAPEDFTLTGQRLMAGLIELELARGTETLKLGRWGLASVALKRKSLEDWLGEQAGKAIRKHAAKAEGAEIAGHPGLRLAGGNVAGVQKLQRFFEHCRGRPYADRFIARAWHCEPTNKVFYVETFVDRENVGLADELVARVQCHHSGRGEPRPPGGEPRPPGGEPRPPGGEPRPPGQKEGRETNGGA